MVFAPASAPHQELQRSASTSRIDTNGIPGPFPHFPPLRTRRTQRSSLLKIIPPRPPVPRGGEFGQLVPARAGPVSWSTPPPLGCDQYSLPDTAHRLQC